MVRYALTIFLGAFLLFQVQPILGRFILPWFGGGAGVWTVCMLFFQMALLAGYAYAHLISSKVPPRRQMAVHLVLIGITFFFLPITPSAEVWRSTGTTEAATFRILMLLALSIGVPYVLLASTGPLLQSWFEKQYPGRSPYRLYSLSNLGSLLALLSYPFLFEPWLTLHVQGLAWSICFVLYALACGWCAWNYFQTVRGVTPAMGTDAADAPMLSELAPLPTTTGNLDASAASGSSEPSRPVQMALWLLLSAVGSIMLVSTTNQICQDLAVVPMLWVAPLAIYLITFIICFDADRWYHRAVWGPLLAGSVLLVNYVMHNRHSTPLVWQIVAFAGALLTTCMVCHGELVRLRPRPSRLTSFYLSIAAGGAMGGAFVALAAPLMFPDYWEYHVGLLAACLLAVICIYRARGFSLPMPKRRLALATASLLWIALGASLVIQAYEKHATNILTTRNFYGVLHLRQFPHPLYGEVRSLNHGLTVHGRQFLDIERLRWPTTYYGEDSGIGLAMEFAAKPVQPDGPRRPIRVGGVGLGVGTIAALTHRDDYLRFYEINPQVLDYANRHFSFLADTPAEVEVIIGDARVMMEGELAADKPQQFDVLAIDAFNSDSIPLHLVTQEAMAIYLKHLKPDGLLAFHISNKYIDLSPVIRGLAKPHGLQVLRIASPSEEERLGTNAAVWMVLTRDDAFVKDDRIQLMADPIAGANAVTLNWTDDFASLWSVITRSGSGTVNKWSMTPNGGKFIIDRADMVTRADERTISYIQKHLFDDASANFPLFVVTVKGVTLNPDGSKPESFEKQAMLMQRNLGLFNPKDDNAIMLIISVDDRQFMVHLGSAWQGQSRQESDRIINEHLLPGLQKNKPSQGILNAVNALDQMARRELARRLENEKKAERGE